MIHTTKNSLFLSTKYIQPLDNQVETAKGEKDEANYVKDERSMRLDEIFTNSANMECFDFLTFNKKKEFESGFKYLSLANTPQAHQKTFD
jgi:hypothetical protein